MQIISREYKIKQLAKTYQITITRMYNIKTGNHKSTLNNKVYFFSKCTCTMLRWLISRIVEKFLILGQSDFEK